MKRREFISLLGGAAAMWPLVARAQQGDRVRRIGVVTSALETDADLQALYAVLRQALQQLGWTEGRNIQFDRRLGSAGDSDVVRRHAQELVALAPDLIVASGSQNVAALQQVSRTVPIVFLATRLALDWRPVLHARAAIQPASHRSNMAWVENGWSYSNRSLRV